MISLFRLVSVCVLGVIGGQTLPAEPAAPVFAPSPALALQPGEKLVYQIGWGLFDRAGRIEVRAADQPRRILSTMASDGTVSRLLTYRASSESVFDDTTGRLRSARFESVSGKRQTNRSITFDPASGAATYRDANNPKRDEQLAAPVADPVDLITCLVSARGWRMQPGAIHDVLVMADKRFYPIRLRALDRQNLATKLGDFATLRVVPEPIGEARGVFRQGGGLQVWIEDQPRALPLRIEVKTRVGTVVAELIEYHPATLDAPVLRALPAPVAEPKPDKLGRKQRAGRPAGPGVF